MGEIHDENESYDAGDHGPVEVNEEEVKRLRDQAQRKWDEAVKKAKDPAHGLDAGPYPDG